MRDILTALAALLILALTAALVVPPFVDWEDRRADLEAALSGAAGARIDTAGAIELRLLPSPRLAVDRLRIGGDDPDGARLHAEGVVVELELTPLLRGQARFSSGSARNAEIILPARAGAAIGVPRVLGHEARPGAAFAFDDLRAERLLLVAADADAPPRTLLEIDGAMLSAQALGGPYRLEGIAQGLPFRLAVGSFDAEGITQARLVAGIDTPVRIEADAVISLGPAVDEIHAAHIAGEARFAIAGEGPEPAPLVVTGDFETQPGGVLFEELAIESGAPGLGTRLEGTGRLALDEPRLSLDLAARRVVVERLLAGPLGRALEAGAAGALPIPVALALAVDGVSVAGEELSEFAARLALAGQQVEVASASALLPGEARVTYSGEIALESPPRLSGSASLVAQDSARLARFLRRLGVDGPLVALLDGPPIDVAADVVVAPDLVALSNLRLAAGDAALTGALRFTPAEGAGRALVEAQIAARGIDVARLPRLPAFTALPHGLDLDVMVDATDVRFEGGEGAGRIQARLASRGEGILVDTLDITDLAGANVSVSGEIAQDGTGRIEGSLEAARAEPLIALLGGVAFGDATRLIPAFLREGELDVGLTLERIAQSGDGPAGLRTGITGIAAGGPIDAQWLTIEGRTERVDVALSTDETRAWLDVEHPLVAGRPSLVTLTLGRSGPDRYVSRLVADIAGTRITTTRPLVLDAIDLTPFDGEVDVSSPDLRPILALLTGRSMAAEAADAQLRASLSRDGADVRLQALGAVAGERLSLDVSAAPGAAPEGSLQVARLSLPWLATALALGEVGLPDAGTWSREAFRPVPPLPFERGRLAIVAQSLDLGAGLVAADARVTLAVLRDGIALEGIEAGLADGRIAADVAIRRPTPESASLVGTLALADIDLAALAPVEGLPIAARATGEIAFGGSGGNLAELVGALAGQGRIALADIMLAGADPSGIGRGVERALEEEDPLGARRLQGFVAEALEARPLSVQGAEAPATLVAGVLALSPLALDEAEGGGFSGSASLDLRSLRLDLAGFLRSPVAPQGWEGPRPAIGFALRGPLADLSRDIDVGPLTNGLAAIVLQRELARIEAFEREASERARRLGALRLAELRRERAEAWAAEVERRRAEEAARRAAEAAARREAERMSLDALEEDLARRAREAERLAEEAARLAQEAEARRLAEEEARRRAREEEEARRALEDEVRRVREEEARLVLPETQDARGDVDSEGLRRLIDDAAR